MLFVIFTWWRSGLVQEENVVSKLTKEPICFTWCVFCLTFLGKSYPCENWYQSIRVGWRIGIKAYLKQREEHNKLVKNGK